jgi:broad specificity phosphatase PhoE
MKHLFLVRPGEFSEEYDKITRDGRQKLQELGASIKQVINNSSIYIITSPASRASDSAEELAFNLNLPEDAVERNPYFSNFNNEEWPQTYKRSMTIIGSKSELADGIILVSNHRIIEAIFCYVMNQKIGKISIIANPWPGTGEHIDLEKKICERIPKRR